MTESLVRVNHDPLDTQLLPVASICHGAQLLAATGMVKGLISADPASHESRTRSVRLHGVVTSLRLENLHWAVLEEIADRVLDGLPFTPPDEARPSKRALNRA